MKILVCLILIILIVVALTLTIRNAQTLAKTEQITFAKGTLPSPPPSGFLRGDAGIQTSWLGKTFYPNKSEGINQFLEHGIQVSRYPFFTYVGMGVKEKGLKVLKLDYNSPKNPLYLRAVLDELVQTAPGKYLGRLNLRLGPFTFALGFFRLYSP